MLARDFSFSNIPGQCGLISFYDITISDVIQLLEYFARQANRSTFCSEQFHGCCDLEPLFWRSTKLESTNSAYFTVTKQKQNKNPTNPQFMQSSCVQRSSILINSTLLGGSGGVVNSLVFYPASLNRLLLLLVRTFFKMEGAKGTLPTLKAFF